jgi:hypothetical protein
MELHGIALLHFYLRDAGFLFAFGFLQASFFFSVFKLLLLVTFAALSQSASFFFDAFLLLFFEAFCFCCFSALAWFKALIKRLVACPIGLPLQGRMIAPDPSDPFSVAFLHLFLRLGFVFSCQGIDAA